MPAFILIGNPLNFEDSIVAYTELFFPFFLTPEGLPFTDNQGTIRIIRIAPSGRRSMAENGQVVLPRPGTHDLALLVKAKKEFAQEKMIAHQTIKLLREDIAECYMKHGVNHFVACKALREEYANLVKDPWLGMKPVS